MNRRRIFLFAVLLPLLGWSLAAEGRVSGTGSLIRSKGSDTMAVVSSRWAAAYQAQTPGITVESSGGSSGNGIAALINGHVDIALTSRPLKPQEVKQIVNRSGKQPLLVHVGLDALSVIVHPLNPLHGLSLQRLAEIYGRNGSMRRWKNMGVVVPGCEDRDIVRVSRKNNSGTYQLFRQDLFQKHQHFDHMMENVENSEAMVQRVAQTPCAIGYVGMGFVTAAVKTLCITKEGGSCVPPTPASAMEKRYPLTRTLYLVTLGSPSDLVKEYIRWILGPTGQEILQKSGFIPTPKTGRGEVVF
ncbi:MAG: phosphate ABC transporter substrate-binding protein [Magnetococcus sp. XQGC-1]